MFMERDEYFLNKMNKQKQEVINHLSRYVGTQFAQDFCHILASAYDYECPVAIRLVDQFRLSQKDLFAMDDNLDGYENECLEDQVQDQVDYEILDDAMGFYE